VGGRGGWASPACLRAIVRTAGGSESGGAPRGVTSLAGGANPTGLLGPGLEHVKVAASIVIDKEDILPIVTALRDVPPRADDNGSGFARHGRSRTPRRG